MKTSGKRTRQDWGGGADEEVDDYENNHNAATANISNAQQDYAEVCGIHDQGEIFFQACLTNINTLKKTFKNLSSFLNDFQFVLSTEGTGSIEVFDYDAYSHDGVDCRIDHFDYFYTSKTSATTFSFTISAKDFMECLSPIPTSSTVLMLYISEHCVDQHQQVFQLSLRAIDLLSPFLYDKNIRTKTSQHASLLSNINKGTLQITGNSNADREEKKDGHADGEEPKEAFRKNLQESFSSPSAMVTQLSRIDCHNHHCIVTWGIKNLLKALANSMAFSKEAKVITFMVNNGEEFVFECNAGNNVSGKSRAFIDETKLFSFTKFEPPSSVCRIVSNSFRVSSILNFMKCKDLCTNVTLYFDQHLPLIVEFEIANFGVLRLFTPTYEKSQE